MESSINLSNVHKSRKQVELDAQMLKNRIKLLQIEEAKTSRRIEETRKRAREVLKLQKEHEDKVKAKKDIQDTRNKEISQQRERNLLTREGHKRNKEIAMKNLFHNKLEDARQIKKRAVEDTEKTNKYLQSLYNYNLFKINVVKNSLKVGNQRVEKFKLNKSSETKTENAKRIEREEQLRTQKEREIAEMEKLELDLIRKLQNTQQIQKETYGDLEKALTKKINRFR